MPNKKNITVIEPVDDQKIDDESEIKRKKAEKDKEPNFFIHGEGIRVFFEIIKFYIFLFSLLEILYFILTNPQF